MTQRVKGCFVAFDQDIREDDAQTIVEAIKALRHVAGVTLSETNHDDYVARERIRMELWEKVRSAFFPPKT